MRRVSFGASDSKTMDTILRFYIASYAEQKKDDTLKKRIIEYSGSNIFKSEEYMQERRNCHKEDGLLDKIDQLKKLIDIGKEGEESNDIMSAVERMLADAFLRMLLLCHISIISCIQCKNKYRRGFF